MACLSSLARVSQLSALSCSLSCPATKSKSRSIGVRCKAEETAETSIARRTLLAAAAGLPLLSASPAFAARRGGKDAKPAAPADPKEEELKNLSGLELKAALRNKRLEELKAKVGDLKDKAAGSAAKAPAKAKEAVEGAKESVGGAVESAKVKLADTLDSAIPGAPAGQY